MRVCIHCGQQNTTGSLFCLACGAPLGEGTGPEPVHAVDPEQPGHDTDTFPAVQPIDVTADLNRATELLAAGRAQEAADACRRILQVQPDSLEAYALLGMAEEELGNWHLAIEAYEGVLQLEPGRIVEREKIAQLQAQLRTRTGEEEREAGQQQRAEKLQRIAPIVLAVAAGLLILLVALLLIVRSHNTRLAREVNETYQLQLAEGQNAVRQRNYEAAVQWFQQAAVTKPDDATAQEWLTWAEQQKQWQTRYAQWLYQTAGGKLLGGQGVLPPTPILPEPPAPPTSAGWVGPPVTPPPSIAQWPAPVRDTTRDITPGQGPIVPPTSVTPGSGTPAEVQPVPPAEAAPPRVTEEPEGEITIERSEQPSRPGGPTGTKLREQADSLRHSGDTKAALATYERAILALQQEIQDNPTAAGVKRSAIQSCRRAIEIIQAAQEQ